VTCPASGCCPDAADVCDPNDQCCTPKSCAVGHDCGVIPDGCGGTLDCGDCTTPDTCGGGGTPGVCGSDACAAFLHRTRSGPPAQEDITVQEETGLQSIVVTTADNADVPVPPFTVGTTDPLQITATKIDQSQPATVALSVTDLAGTVVTCTVTF
jgi:hypothetical protein